MGFTLNGKFGPLSLDEEAVSLPVLANLADHSEKLVQLVHNSGRWESLHDFLYRSEEIAWTDPAALTASGLNVASLRRLSRQLRSV